MHFLACSAMTTNRQMALHQQGNWRISTVARALSNVVRILLR